MNTMNDQSSALRSFPFYLRRSFYVHLALIGSTLVGSKVAYEIAQKQREANLELIEASVRVDMVAMPKYTIAELKNISRGSENQSVVEEVKESLQDEKTLEKTEEPKVEVAETTTEAKEAEVGKEENTPDPVAAFEKEAAQKKQDFLAKLQKLSKQKVSDNKPAVKKDSNTKKSKEGEAGLGGVDTTSLKNLVMSGNKLSEGTALTGSGNSGNLTAFQAYASRLPDLVRPHWTLPSYLLDKNLQCRIRVWLNDNGDVVKTEIFKSSGDQEYDQRAVRAVKAASPFPALSNDLGQRAQNGDILLGFPL